MIVNRAFPCEVIFKVTLCNFVCSFLALLSVGKTNGVHKMLLIRFVLLLASVNNHHTNQISPFPFQRHSPLLLEFGVESSWGPAGTSRFLRRSLLPPRWCRWRRRNPRSGRASPVSSHSSSAACCPWIPANSNRRFHYQACSKANQFKNKVVKV